MKSIKELKEIFENFDREYSFEKGQFVVNKKRFSCDINPQNKLCIEILPLGQLPQVFAVEDGKPGYFNFIKQASVRDGEYSTVKQFPLTTKYCENRREVAEEILRLMG